MTRGGTSLAPQTHGYPNGEKQKKQREKKKFGMKSWLNKMLPARLVCALTNAFRTLQQADYLQVTLSETVSLTFLIM